MPDKTDYTKVREACDICGATGVKLWREYQSFSPMLYCVDHAIEKQGRTEVRFPGGVLRAITLRDIRDDGSHLADFGSSFEIGWFVPAVPTDEGDGWWGYSSIPPERVAWWKSLPLR